MREEREQGKIGRVGIKTGGAMYTGRGMVLLGPGRVNP